jgi:hypothetical protein
VPVDDNADELAPDINDDDGAEMKEAEMKEAEEISGEEHLDGST